MTESRAQSLRYIAIALVACAVLVVALIAGFPIVLAGAVLCYMLAAAALPTEAA